MTPAPICPPGSPVVQQGLGQSNASDDKISAERRKARHTHVRLLNTASYRLTYQFGLWHLWNHINPYVGTRYLI